MTERIAVMKWIPFTVAAYIIAFADVSHDRAVVALIFCFIAFLYALHFDNQIMKFLTVIGQFIVEESKRRAK